MDKCWYTNSLVVITPTNVLIMSVGGQGHQTNGKALRFIHAKFGEVRWEDFSKVSRQGWTPSFGISSNDLLGQVRARMGQKLELNINKMNDCRGRDHMVDGFYTTYAIRAHRL